MSVLEVLGVKDSVVYVKGMDMLGGTPVLDSKPCILDKHDCPSFVAKDDPQLRNPRE
jgi:tRNA (Thr-GGU) A37 N-methylase